MTYRYALIDRNHYYATQFCTSKKSAKAWIEQMALENKFKGADWEIRRRL